MHRDYAPKGVKFFYVYKSLAHPELAGGYVQPFELKERLAHARQAEKQLGSSIPWIVDAMDNRLKHAMGDRPNSEFIIDPKGVIVRKRWWSHPGLVRTDLEALVGKVEKVTKEEDIKLKLGLPVRAAAERGVLTRIRRPRMPALVMEPQSEGRKPFFAKLRAEGEATLFVLGEGKMYLGFHLDPFHDAHWNNLTPPLKFKLEVPAGFKIDKLVHEAPKVKAASDADPREFMLNVRAWPEDKPIVLTVTYSACVGEKACHVVKQSYVLHRKRDRDGGMARGRGPGFWDEATFARQHLAAGKLGDKVTEREVAGLIRPHFRHFDTNNDGFLDFEELKIAARWLNGHHEPGPSPKRKGKAKE